MLRLLLSLALTAWGTFALADFTSKVGSFL